MEYANNDNILFIGYFCTVNNIEPKLVLAWFALIISIHFFLTKLRRILIKSNDLIKLRVFILSQNNHTKFT